MKKLTLLCLSIGLFAATSFAQTKDPVQKAITDPKREANSAKADVHVQHKTIVAEESQKNVAVADKKKKKSACCKGGSCHKKS